MGSAIGFTFRLVEPVRTALDAGGAVGGKFHAVYPRRALSGSRMFRGVEIDVKA